MTLRQQFSLLTGLLVVILLAGSLVLTISNGRDYFQQQLNARAYDAATSLALSMSTVLLRPPPISSCSKSNTPAFQSGQPQS